MRFELLTALRHQLAAWKTRPKEDDPRTGEEAAEHTANKLGLLEEMSGHTP